MTWKVLDWGHECDPTPDADQFKAGATIQCEDCGVKKYLEESGDPNLANWWITREEDYYE